VSSIFPLVFVLRVQGKLPGLEDRKAADRKGGARVVLEVVWRHFAP